MIEELQISTQGVQPSHAERILNLEKQVNVLKSYRAFSKPGAPYALALEGPPPAAPAKRGYGAELQSQYQPPAALYGAGGGPADDNVDVKRRLANDEKLLVLAVHGLHRDLANLADLWAISAKESSIADRSSPVAALRHAERHRHLVHSCSREGILELTSGARHHWLLGFDRGGGRPGSGPAAAGAYRPISAAARVARAAAFATARHELDLVPRLWEVLDTQLQELLAVDDLVIAVDGSLEKVGYTSMAAARTALDAYEPQLNQLANTCLLLEFCVLNDVNMACLALVGQNRLHGLVSGLLRALTAVTARASGRGPLPAQAQPRKLYLRCADVLRFLTAACRDAAVQAAFAQSFANLGAFLTLLRRERYPVLAVEAMRLLRVIFLGGPGPSK